MRCKILKENERIKKGDISYHTSLDSVVLIINEEYIRVDKYGFSTVKIPIIKIQTNWLKRGEMWFRKVLL